MDEQIDNFEDLDTKEIDIPETIYIRDIETRVFQSITIKCLSGIDGVGLLEGTLMDNLLGREGLERIKGIYVEQDPKNRSVSIKVELNVYYGISLPEKSEEIQEKIVQEVTRLTGLHVTSVHVVFKNLLLERPKLEENTPSEDAALEEEDLEDFITSS
ncbi:Asp23/Gls24 family envelope stress response protein [bacterium]|nr:Asp23/Gls24 family envelope stress response protein [bacterium]